MTTRIHKSLQCLLLLVSPLRWHWLAITSPGFLRAHLWVVRLMQNAVVTCEMQCLDGCFRMLFFRKSMLCNKSLRDSNLPVTCTE